MAWTVWRLFWVKAYARLHTITLIMSTSDTACQHFHEPYTSGLNAEMHVINLFFQKRFWIHRNHVCVIFFVGHLFSKAVKSLCLWVFWIFAHLGHILWILAHVETAITMRMYHVRSDSEGVHACVRCSPGDRTACSRNRAEETVCCYMNLDKALRNSNLH